MKIKNRWRGLFFLLLSINLIILLILFILIMSAPRYDDKIEEVNTEKKDIQIITNNETVERVINEYIGNEDLSVKIDQKGILFNTKYPVLGKKIDINIQVDPVVHKDKIVLNLVNIDVMRLPINEDYFYSFMKKYIPLEPGLSYSEDAKAIIVDSKIFTSEMEMDVTINKIDYKNDAWYFSIDNLFKD